ncbi:unnamed protein product [Aphanomyces euteiches]|uniref:Exocyst complex component 8 n=1 Tax=Aphanomyces euteiches TaxID=100861 RepID=A0A6G0X925_9STRA|nr:hypothetical protein Ae201684_007403 [Aphanomyces euteiches]KAH9144781.1 hypothetical protein AeRB84_011283 [Aphanomyces euteiches]
MVSAREVAQIAVYGGPLEKKGRTGWKKKYFYLTSSHWIYFDSLDATIPNFTIAATEISFVEEVQSSVDARSSQSAPSFTSRGFGFNVVVGKKKTELRAATEDERDGWIGALMPYVAEADSLLSPTHSHHPKSRSRAELSKVADTIRQKLAMQKKKSQFTPQDVVQALGKIFPDLSPDELVEWGETLLNAKLILGASFEAGTPLRLPDKAKKKLTASERSKLGDLMSSVEFDAKLYAESFLKRNAPEKIDEHCDTLLDQKDSIIHELKNDICANYTTFLVASSEIRKMENNVSLMKAAIVECKRSLQLLLSSTEAIPSLPTVAESNKQPSLKVTSSHDALQEFEHSLDMYLFEQDYDKFTELVLAIPAKDPAHEAVANAAIQRFVQRVTGADHLSRDRNVLHLIQLDQVPAATQLCLQGYAERMVAQVRAVKPIGNTLQFVLTLSRTVFTTLLMCFEDFLVVFDGQASLSFASFTMWMTDELRHFAREVCPHIFESSDHFTWVSRDVTEFKTTSKNISTCLRHLFYGARQLELAGLPIATYLAPHFQTPLQQHIATYAKTIKWKAKEEIKRERWELMVMKVRDDEMKEKDVVLSKSARVFSSYIQQYLRDVGKILHSSCATSHLREIQVAVVHESELVLVQYMQDIKAVFDNPKTLASIKYSQVASMLITMQYIEEDILPRVEEALQKCLPPSQLTDFGSKIRSLGEEVASGSMVRLAKALMANSMRWPELSLSAENLPKENDTTTMFLTNLRNDLTTVTPDQLEQLTKHTEEADDAALRLIELMLMEIVNNDASFVAKQKALGYGGTSQFIAELRMLSKDKAAQLLEQKLRQEYSTFGKKGGSLAPETWFAQFESSMAKK